MPSGNNNGTASIAGGFGLPFVINPGPSIYGNLTVSLLSGSPFFQVDIGQTGTPELIIAVPHQVNINVDNLTVAGVTNASAMVVTFPSPNVLQIALGAATLQMTSTGSLTLLGTAAAVIVGTSSAMCTIDGIAGTIQAGSGGFKFNGTKVVGARVTGWTAATNTKSKATFDTTTVTLPNLAARVGQIIDDLIAHGLIGA